MTMRNMAWSALVVGVCWMGVACNPVVTDAQAQEPETDAVEQEAGGVGATCGGFAGIQCDPGYVCVDNPNDSCDPRNGGRDCSGLCQCGQPPDYGYLANSPEKCATIRFKCDTPRYEPFFNACGCGCKVAGS